MRLIIVLFLLLPFCLLAQKTESEKAFLKKHQSDETYYHMGKTHSFHLGIGFPNTVDLGLNIVGLVSGSDVSAKASPQFTFKYEYGLNETIGIGTHFGYYTGKTGEVNFNLDADALSGVGGLLDFINCLIDSNSAACADDLNQTANYRINAYSIGLRAAVRRRAMFGIEKLDFYGSFVGAYNYLTYKDVLSAKAEVGSVRAPTFSYAAVGGARYFLAPEWGIYGEAGYSNITFLNIGATYRIFSKKWLREQVGNE